MLCLSIIFITFSTSGRYGITLGQYITTLSSSSTSLSLIRAHAILTKVSDQMLPHLPSIPKVWSKVLILRLYLYHRCKPISWTKWKNLTDWQWVFHGAQDLMHFEWQWQRRKPCPSSSRVSSSSLYRDLVTECLHFWPIYYISRNPCTL